MSFKSISQQTTTTHRSHAHNIHRSSTLFLATQLLPATPPIEDCYSGTATHAAKATPTEAGEDEASYDFVRNGTIDDSTIAPDTLFDAHFRLDDLDFSLTRRLLCAVFFLLVIYAWKQYIDDEEASDIVYI